MVTPEVILSTSDHFLPTQTLQPQRMNVSSGSFAAGPTSVSETRSDTLATAPSNVSYAHVAARRWGAWRPADYGRVETLDQGPLSGQDAYQTSVCSAISSASSTSIPRYRIVLSSLVWPSSSWTARRFLVRR